MKTILDKINENSNEDLKGLDLEVFGLQRYHVEKILKQDISSDDIRNVINSYDYPNMNLSYENDEIDLPTFALDGKNIKYTLLLCSVNNRRRNRGTLNYVTIALTPKQMQILKEQFYDIKNIDLYNEIVKRLNIKSANDISNFLYELTDYLLNNKIIEQRTLSNIYWSLGENLKYSNWKDNFND